MFTAEEKRLLVCQQVIAKIHWGAPEEEVSAWLDERHGISGAPAHELLLAARFARRRALRVKAIYTFCASTLGLVMVGGFFWLTGFFSVPYSRGLELYGVFNAAIFGAGLLSAGVFLYSLWLLITGEKITLH